MQFSDDESLSWADALLEFSFLSPLPESDLTLARSARSGGVLYLLRLRPFAGAIVGYTLLARRTQTWSARAVVRAPGLEGGPPAGIDPDPRRAAELTRPDVLEPLTGALAWLQVEGPWRVIGISRAGEVSTVEAILALGAQLFPLISEPDEFAGGLEWNI